MSCDHTQCRAYEAATGISGCHLSWGENYRRERGRSHLQNTPPTLKRRDVYGALPSGPLPAPSSRPSGSADTSPSLGYEPAGGDYDPFDPYEPRNVHLRQGRSVEQYRRNEDMAVYVFGACVGFAALLWIVTALAG